MYLFLCVSGFLACAFAFGQLFMCLSAFGQVPRVGFVNGFCLDSRAYCGVVGLEIIPFWQHSVKPGSSCLFVGDADPIIFLSASPGFMLVKGRCFILIKLIGNVVFVYKFKSYTCI